MRTIVLHYHLFKNAGTSLDAILKKNFGQMWMTREFSGRMTTAQVEDWIRETPDGIAYSSHTMSGPIPKVDGVRIVSVMLLRDPIDRIRSAYQFERHQTADTFGAVLAKHTDLEGYVRVRLSLPHDRQCRNFQTDRLASFVPGKNPELERAIEGLQRLSVVGLVSNFGGALDSLAHAIADEYPDFSFAAIHENKSSAKKALSDELTTLLQDHNADDVRVLDHVRSQMRAAVQNAET